MITPALFIGLGSTGFEILERLQNLVLEEYGIPSLPIFQYVAFETDQDQKLGTESEIILTHPTIGSTDAVETAINRGERNYYNEWLDKTVLKIPGGMFVAGAGNIRMAGRLCLWENWQTLASDKTKPGCASVLQSAQEIVTADKNRLKTTNILNEIYGMWDKPIPDLGIQIEPKPNVYIVGTFCGGTCGGMFIDIAYYVKHLFGLWKKDIGGQRAKVIGVFTVYDSNDLINATNDTKKNHAANCWASLLEYDYYCHDKSRYNQTFPDGTQIDTNERSLDYLYLLSCSGNQTNLHMEDGSPDVDSLANMAATVLFSETVEGLLGQKERIRIDRLSKPRALTPNKNQHMASIASCGHATFRYPKYRVVEGASNKYAVDLCNKWIGSKSHADQSTNITREANEAWYTIKNNTKDMLIHTPSGLLTDVVKNWFDNMKDELLNKTQQEIIKSLRAELNEFGEGEQYDKSICNRQNELIEGIKQEKTKGILDLINDEIIKKLNEKKNINYVEEFLIEIDSAIENTIRNEKPDEYPAPDISKASQGLTVDMWTKSLGKANAVYKEMKEDYLEEIKEEFISQIEKMRNYRFKAVLEEVRQKIGIVPPPEEWMGAGIRTYKQELDIIENMLNECVKEFKNKVEKMSIKLEKTQDVMIITKGKDMSEDIENLHAKLKTQTDSNIILKKARSRVIGGQVIEVDFHKWLGYAEPKKDRDRLKKTLINSIRDEALKWREKFIIANEVLKRGRSLGGNLCQFVENSLPHLQLKGDLAGITVGDPPEFVGGKDEDKNVTQIKNLCSALMKCSNPVKFEEKFKIHMEELDHLLLFYREEALIYMDENFSTAGLFNDKYHTYEDFLKKHRDAATRTVHTHRLGSSYFNVWIEIRREEASKLMQIAQEIFSTRDEKGKWNESEVFKVDGNSLVLRFKLPDGSNEVIKGDEKGIERLALTVPSFNYFQELLKERAKKVGRKGFIERVNRLADWIEENAKRKEHPDPISIANKKRDEYLRKDNPERLEFVLFLEEDKNE